MTEFSGYENWKGWSRDRFGAYSPEDAIYYAAELRRTNLDSSRPLRVLEIGFGNGGFACWARQQGFEYCGTEMNQELVERGVAAGLQVIAATDGVAPKLGDAVDLVVAFDVFEHRSLAELQADLLGLREVLRPGGVVLARIPSGDSPFGRAILHGDLTHRSALGTSAIHQLAMRCGYEVVEVGPPALPVRRLGLRRGFRRLALRAARAVTARFINAVFHDNQPLVITSNLVFVLRLPDARGPDSGDGTLPHAP